MNKNYTKDSSEEKFVFEFYDDLDGELDEKSIPLVDKYNAIDFEENLNEEQLQIINNIKGPMLVIAGAGSGKTRTITFAVAKLLLSGIPPNNIMLVTFTNKAAKEMINRLKKLLGRKPKGIWAGTFHSMANRFLRKYAKTLDLKPNYTIMDQTDAKGLMKLAMEEADTSELKERFPTSAMAKRILSYSINCNKSIREVILWKYPQFDKDIIEKKLEEVFKRYRTKKERDGLLDFDDLLVYWNRLLDEKLIARMIARNIRYILVDEYQDTNYIQDEIINKIATLNTQRNIMVVGDDAQSIYAFRGADFQNILNFEKKFSDCKKFRITYNYRSVPEILNLANDSIKHNKRQYKKKMKAVRSSSEMKPFLVNTSDDEEQAKFIANQVLKLREEGFQLKQMAVLFRASHHSIKIEQELKTKNIPYEVRAGVAFFEKAHIKDALVHLRILENPYDEIAWSRIFDIIPGLGMASGSKIFQEFVNTKNPLKLITSKEFFAKNMKGARIPSAGSKKLIAHLTPLVPYSSEEAPSEVLSVVIKLLTEHLQTSYENWKERLEDLKALAIYSQNYTTIRRFLETLSLNRSDLESKTVKKGNQHEEEKPLILSTIHRAKGLEWRVVFIPMLCESFFPSHQVLGDQDALEEERRVFYVAVTRAKDQLYLISPALVQSWKGYRTEYTSQFVQELNHTVYTTSSVDFKSKPSSRFQTADQLLGKNNK